MPELPADIPKALAIPAAPENIESLTRMQAEPPYPEGSVARLMHDSIKAGEGYVVTLLPVLWFPPSQTYSWFPFDEPIPPPHRTVNIRSTGFGTP